MTVSVPFCQLRSFDRTERQWILKKGKYDIMVGTSWSKIAETYAISMDEDIVYSSDCKTAKARPLYQDHRKEVLIFDDVRKGTATVEELVAQLTVEEMAWLCVGTERGEEDNVIGSSSMQVPGAAGETTHLLEVSRGIPSMVFSDGPAGLRLEPHFRTDGQGNMLDANQREKNTEIIEYYQYCTAIPIATTLAQSWDRELLKTYGKLIAEEMAQYHVHLWLAPGMNIHRNPLCGRNFEYFSEDPLLSGSCAAAEVQGVQSVKGCGATIKHFACNNQEENRMFVNAHVDKKALREIYLKGFEIAVKESQPMAIMTSYNLLNGIHTANHYELLQQICRDDWGFEGMIMTDWYTSQDVSFMGISSNKYPYSSSALCIKAGNDLQMPGCEENVEEIIHGIETGIITKADLQFCASNILRCILRLMP